MNELNWIEQQAQCLYMLFAENDILNKCIYFFGQKRVTGAPLVNIAQCECFLRENISLNIMFTWNVHLSKLYVIDHK